MKRILFLAVAATLILAPAAMAQKVDEEGLLKKIEKSDGDIANPKRNTRAQTWIDRGNVFTEVATAASSALYSGVETVMVERIMGKATASEPREVGGKEYTVWVYPYVDVYIEGPNVLFWKETKTVVDNAAEQAYEAFDKAYELDSSAANAKKVSDGMLFVATLYQQAASNLYNFQEYANAANEFERAYNVKLHPSLNEMDTLLIYNAGYLNTVAGNHAKAIPQLEKSIEAGYTGNNGDAIYYLAYDYINTGQGEKGKDLLFTGLKQFPSNSNIVETLVQYYVSNEEDPADIIDIVKEYISKEPDNAVLWDGLARIYDQMGNTAEAVAAMEKVVELVPTDFASSYNLGLFRIKIGDDMNQELNKQNFTGQNEYNAALQKVFDAYKEAIPPLERAYEIDPKNPIAIELLKNVTFRLRDEPGMMEKYEKYNELFKQIQ